ncbi:MAG: formylglycine-generating enzyme family protein, partial [Terriglobales bacterium]
MNHAAKVWPLLQRAPDENVRSYLIHWSPPLGVDRQTVIARWQQETDVGIRSALTLLLGEFPDSTWPAAERARMVDQLLTVFERAPDPGLHAAAEWLLRRWKCDDDLRAALDRLAKNDSGPRAARASDEQGWYVNRQGQTFAIVDARQSFKMGSPADEPEREKNETQHARNVGRRFAIAACPVTKRQFQRFLIDRPGVKEKMPPESIAEIDDSPQTGMTWYEAAEYCNWLSKKEGMPSDQCCYEPNAQGEFAAGMRAKDNYLALGGYRLPTEAEWEFACRGGTTTRYYFGQGDALLADYAWYKANSQDHAWRVAGLKPNDFGLFDVLGNVWQWCDSPSKDFPKAGLGVADDSGSSGTITNEIPRAVRGGAYNNLPGHVRAAYRGLHIPTMREESFGFRPARTIGF